VDGGSDMNIISMKFYDVWGIPKMDSTPFSIKLTDQTKVMPLGLVKNVPMRVAGIWFLIAFVVMELPSYSSSYLILLGRSWLKGAVVMHDWKNKSCFFKVGMEPSK